MAGAAHRFRVPVVQPPARAHGGPERGAAPAADELVQEGPRRARQGRPRGGRPGGSHGSLPAPAVGRSGAARGDRARHRGGPHADPSRRAHRTARREELAGGARAAAEAQRGVQQDDRRRHPRCARGGAGQDGPPPRERRADRESESGVMRHLTLVRANLGRHLRRTVLTIASVALALFLFASLRTVVTTIALTGQFGSARRLVVTNATGIVFPLPLAYANRLSAVPGVQAVSWANWFGGRYGDGKRFFANFAVDAESYLKMYPELVLPPEQREAWLKDKSSAIIGVRLLDVFGWQLGQNVTLQGTIFPGDWTFTIRGVYRPSDAVLNDDMLLFHHALLRSE